MALSYLLHLETYLSEPCVSMSTMTQPKITRVHLRSSLLRLQVLHAWQVLAAAGLAGQRPAQEPTPEGQDRNDRPS